MELKEILDDKVDDSTWFEIGGQSFEVCIRDLKPKEYDVLNKRCEVKTRKGTEVDQEKLAKLCLDAMVTDWRGLESDGEPYPCNTQNKIELDENWMPFRLFWSGRLRDRVEQTVSINEAVVKN